MALYSFLKSRLTVTLCIFLICSSISHTLSPCVLRTTQGSRECSISILNIRRQSSDVNFLKVAQLLHGIARAGIIMASELNTHKRFYIYCYSFKCIILGSGCWVPWGHLLRHPGTPLPSASIVGCWWHTATLSAKGPPSLRSCPLSRDSPHSMTGRYRGLQAWPPPLNSGQLWGASHLQLPMGSQRPSLQLCHSSVSPTA